jgi:hypothetical protein
MQTSEYACALIVRLSGTLAAYGTVPVELLNSGWNMKMKYMISWNERPQVSPVEYENAQKRILEVFSPWKAPNDFKIESFVIRVGDWGGYMLMGLRRSVGSSQILLDAACF